MQNLQNPAAAGYQVAAGSAQGGSGIAPVSDTLNRDTPHTQSEISHSYKENTAVNAGLGAQSMDGGKVLKGDHIDNDKKKKRSCIVQ